MLPDQENELFHQIALTFVPDVGPKTTRALLARYGTAAAIFKAPPRDLRSVEGVGELRAKRFRDAQVKELAEKELAFVQQQDIRPLFIGTEHYPKKFLECEDAPVLLYFKGNADLNAKKTVAVVGTRKQTDYGQRATEDLIAGLQGFDDLLIVSGLALGIDTTAHKACLRHGIPTVGALGHSLDIIYPHSNKTLARDMLLNGGLLSEFPSGTGPDRQNFPVRNRVVAGMSDITVIVESDVKGGAMITAYVAHGYNREVAAYPGRAFDSKSEGPNALIKRNVAALVTSADDLLELMNWGRHEQKKVKQQQLFTSLSPEEEQLMALLRDRDAVHADELLHQSGFASPQLAAILLQLEMQGMVKALPGKQYRAN